MEDEETMSDTRERYSQRAKELAGNSDIPETACYKAVSFLGGTAGEYLITDETLALLIAVANGLMSWDDLPSSLKIE